MLENQNNIIKHTTTALGVSNQLRQEFSLLAETKLCNGCDKFSQKSVRALSAHLVCRNYANLSYEFSHLMWLILHANGLHKASKKNITSFFWLSNGHHKSGFKAYMQACLTHYHRIDGVQPINPSVIQSNGSTEYDDSQCISVTQNMFIVVKEKDVTLSVNGQDFTVSYSRANVLACFMEWLILAIPNLLDIAETALLGQGANAIKGFANTLQKQIYAYLGDHLLPAKLQKRYRLLSEYYQNQPVTCQQVLEFWQLYKQYEGCSKYAGVLQDTIAFKAAKSLEHSFNYQHETSYSNSSSITNETQSIYNEIVDKVCIDLSSISKVPKVLNNNQIGLAKFIAQHPLESVKMPHSYLRLHVFSHMQTRLIQAKRDKAIKAFDEYISDDYAACLQQIKILIAYNHQAMFAIYALLANTHCKQAGVLLINICKASPDLHKYTQPLIDMLNAFYSDFADKWVKVSHSHKSYQRARNQAYLVQSQKWQSEFEWFDKLILQGNHALKVINRKGFTKQTLLLGEQYIDAAETILKLNKALNRLVLCIEQQNLQCDEIFSADRSIFFNEFNQLYIQEES